MKSTFKLMKIYVVVQIFCLLPTFDISLTMFFSLKAKSWDCAYVCVRRRRSSMSSCLPNNTVILTKKISTAAIENMTTKALEQQHTAHVHPLFILFSPFQKCFFFFTILKLLEHCASSHNNRYSKKVSLQDQMNQRIYLTNFIRIGEPANFYRSVVFGNVPLHHIITRVLVLNHSKGFYTQFWYLVWNTWWNNLVKLLQILPISPKN